MKKNSKKHVKVGDLVTIISGFHKNKTGEIIFFDREKNRVIIKGLNFRFQSIQKKNSKTPGQIIQIEKYIHSSNVKLTTNKIL